MVNDVFLLVFSFFVYVNEYVVFVGGFGICGMVVRYEMRREGIIRCFVMLVCCRFRVKMVVNCYMVEGIFFFFFIDYRFVCRFI